jgi:hypothetical protein
MIEIFYKKRKSKTILVFVHGFKGGKNTWVKNNKCTSFIQNIMKDSEIKKEVDVAVFSYYTYLLKFFPKTRGFFKKFIFKKKSPTNTTISELGNILETDIKYYCENYKNIILICHSMGGLVAKRYILNQIKLLNKTNVKLYISLATPHSGSDLASLGAKLIDNCQVNDMQPLSENINTLNNEWIKCNLLPKRVYAYGTSDSIVSKSSAVSLDRDEQRVIATDHDHFSIIHTKDKDDPVIVAIKSEIKKTLSNCKAEEINNEFLIINKIKKSVLKLQRINDDDYIKLKSMVTNQDLMNALNEYHFFERKRGNIHELEKIIDNNNLINKLNNYI